MLPAELEDDDDDEEADPLDDGRLLLLLLLLALPALRGLRAAALLEAVPLWNRPVEGRRLAAAADVDEEGRPVPVRDVDEAGLGLPVDGVDEERVDRRFRGAEARGILVAVVMSLSLSFSLFLSLKFFSATFRYFRFWKNERTGPAEEKRNERSQQRAIKRTLPAKTCSRNEVVHAGGDGDVY